MKSQRAKEKAPAVAHRVLPRDDLRLRIGSVKGEIVCSQDAIIGRVLFKIVVDAEEREFDLPMSDPDFAAAVMQRLKTLRVKVVPLR